MNSSPRRVGKLPLSPLVGTYWRAIPAAVARQGRLLSTAHAHGRRNRFNPGPLAKKAFALIYLAKTRLVAAFEVRALFGNPTRPGGWVANPASRYAYFRVKVNLSAVVDLTDPHTHGALATTAQELTGDWQGYEWRRWFGSVRSPVGRAPTQELGEALHSHGGIEGFLTLSAVVPFPENLVIFPGRLRADSFIHAAWKTSVEEIRGVET
jgi:hypothetical protein